MSKTLNVNFIELATRVMLKQEKLSMGKDEIPTDIDLQEIKRFFGGKDW